MSHISLDRVTNAPALAKPDVFLAFDDGDDVLYLDSADVLVLERPLKLFGLFQSSGAALGAYPYEPRASGIVGESAEHGLLTRLLADVRMGKRYNDGVILARLGLESRLFMRYWKMLLGHAPYVCTFAGVGAARTVVGDQVAFNVCISALVAYGRVLDLPSTWNYRGYIEVNACEVRDGGLYNARNERICIAHASGSKPIRPDIVKLATEGI